MIIWLNGRLAHRDSIRIDPADRGLALGDGIFETMAAGREGIQWLDAHLERLRAGASTIGIPLPHLDFEAALAETLAANKLESAVLRLTVTRGIAGRGLLPPDPTIPTVLITAAPRSAAPPLPARCVTATVTRRNEFSPLSRIKSLNYLDNILARMEAEKRGADDAIVLNSKGRVAETTVANVFVMTNGTILTPPIEEGALPGIVRRMVIHHMVAREAPLSLDDLYGAEEIFLTNSLGIRPVVALDDRPFAPVGLAHEIARRLNLGITE